MEQQYLTDRDLAARYGISRRTVWRWVTEGKLPQPEKLTDRCSRWIRTEIEQLELEARTKARAATVS
jgi:prophage regulatory protein